jgi:hypothetical protein
VCCPAYAQTFDPHAGIGDIPADWMPAMMAAYEDMKKNHYDLKCHTIGAALNEPIEKDGVTYREVLRVGTGYAPAYRAALFGAADGSVDVKGCGATHMYYVAKSGKIILKETKKN